MEIIEHGKTYLVYTCPRCLCVFVACEIDACENDWATRIGRNVQSAERKYN